MRCSILRFYSINSSFRINGTVAEKISHPPHSYKKSIKKKHNHTHI